MMSRPLRRASPAFLFFGIFTGHSELFDAAVERIVEAYGPLHPRGASEEFPFPQTETYRKSMGPNLKRRFYVVENRLPQDELAPVKHFAIDLEDEILRGPGREIGLDRPINIDPGLINDCRILLATTKDYAHRIYRGDGIWEEITLVWRGGAYDAMPWTYRDFKNPAYHQFFAPFREEFLKDRR